MTVHKKARGVDDSGSSAYYDDVNGFWVSFEAEPAGSADGLDEGREKMDSSWSCHFLRWESSGYEHLVLCLSVVSDSCGPMDCGPPGSSVHGISQARTVEQIAISYSRGSSQPRDRAYISCSSCIGK